MTLYTRCGVNLENKICANVHKHDGPSFGYTRDIFVNRMFAMILFATTTTTTIYDTRIHVKYNF